MSVEDWVGLPYADLGRGPVAYDCLGLFLALQWEFMGVGLPDPACTVQEAVRRGVVDDYRDGWVRIGDAADGEARFGDAVLFRRGGAVSHVGFVLNARDMLHTGRDTGRSRIETFRGFLNGARLEGIYRYGA